MAGRGGLCAGLLERELLGCRRAYVPNNFSHAFTCHGKQAGVIRVDPDGEQCPPYSITYNQVANGCRFLTVGDEEGCVSIVDTSADTLPTSLYTDHERPPRAKWLAHNNTIFDMAWAKNDSMLYTASGDQHVGVWDTAAGRLRVYCAGHDGSVKAVCPHSTQPDMFASGSRDGGILLWDLRTPSRWSAAKRRMQLGPVMRIDIATAPGQQHGQAAGAAGTSTSNTPGSGTKKGKAGAGSSGAAGSSPWGGSGGRAGGTNNCRRSVTSLLFVRNEHTMISSSDMDGVVKLWDLRRLTTPTGDITLPAGGQAAAAAGGGNGGRRAGSAGRGRAAAGKHGGDDDQTCWLGFTCPSRSSRPAGITSMALSPAGDMLLVSSIDSCHYLYSLAALDQPPVATLTGHRTDSFCIKSCFSPCGNRVLSGSSDKRAYIWDVSQPSAPPVTLPGHSGEVTAVAWCPGDHCQIVTAADDATLRVWAMDRSNSRYEQNYNQYNHNFADSEQGLWGRLVGGSSKAAAQAGSAVEQPAGETAAAARLPELGPASAVTAGGKPGVPSLCSPATPQLPFWRCNGAAAAAGGPEGTSAAPASSAGAAGTTPGAVDDVCRTPAGQRCMGLPGSTGAGGVSPVAQAQQAATSKQHTTLRLRQTLIHQQLSASRLTRQQAQAAVAAAPGAEAGAAAAAQGAPAQQTPAAAAAPTGTEIQQQQQQNEDNIQQDTTMRDQQQEQASLPASPGRAPAAAAACNGVSTGAANNSAAAAAGTAGIGAAAPAAVSPVTGAQQAFTNWMNALTPSPASSPEASQHEHTNMPLGSARAAAAGTGSAQQPVGSVGALQRPPRPSTCRRSGIMELSTPWDLPTPIRQQRQAEHAALEAERLQQYQRMSGLSLQDSDGYGDRDRDGGGGLTSPAARGGGAGGAGSSCCRLLQDEFEVFCDEEGSGAAAGAGADGSAGAATAAAAVESAGTAAGKSCQENLWQPQPQQLEKADVVADDDVFAVGDVEEESPAGDDVGPCSPPVDMVPCSLPQDAPAEEQQHEQLQQQPALQPISQQRQQQAGLGSPLSGVQSPRQHHQQQVGGGGVDVGVLLRIASGSAISNVKPGEVLLAAGVGRKPLGDLSKLLPAAEPGLTSPVPTHNEAAAGLGGRDGSGVAGVGGVGSVSRGMDLSRAVTHRNSPVRALNMSGMPGSPAAGAAGAADSPLLQMLQHGRLCSSQQQHGVGGLVRSPAERQLLSPVRHSPGAAGEAGRKRLSRLGDKQLSPLMFGSPICQQLQQQQQSGAGDNAAAAGVPQAAPAGVLSMMQGNRDQQQQWQLGAMQDRQQQQLLLRSPAAAGDDAVPNPAAGAEEGQGEAAGLDAAAAAAGAGGQQAPCSGRSGGIKRSSVAPASSRKRQCNLVDMWTAKPPTEVEDGYSRFSGF